MRLNVGASVQRVQPLLRGYGKQVEYCAVGRVITEWGGYKRRGYGGRYGMAAGVGCMDDAETNVGSCGGY